MDICKDMYNSYRILKNKFPNISNSYNVEIENVINDFRCQQHFLIKITCLKTLIFATSKSGSTSIFLQELDKNKHNKFSVDRVHKRMVSDYSILRHIYSMEEYNDINNDNIRFTSVIAIIYIIFIKKQKLNVICIYRDILEQCFSSLFYTIIHREWYVEHVSKLDEAWSDSKFSLYNVLLIQIHHYIEYIKIYMEYSNILIGNKNVFIQFINTNHLKYKKNINQDIYYEKFKSFMNRNLIFKNCVKKILYNNVDIKSYLKFFQSVIEDEDCNFR